MRAYRRLIALLGLLLLAGCLPRIPGPAIGALRVMTYNIHHGVGTDDYFNLGAAAEVIRRSGARIVALQEVDRRWGARSLFLDETARLAALTGKHPAFGAALDRDPEPGRGEYGLAILSDYPIVQAEMHLLPGQLEQRGVLLVWLETPWGRMPAAGIHLGLSQADRAAQIAAALNWLPDRPDLLLMGDFNVEAAAPEMQQIHRRLQDMQALAGPADGTFYYQGAWRRIDFIFAGAAWQPTACAVPKVPASDHRPVVVDLERR